MSETREKAAAMHEATDIGTKLTEAQVRLLRDLVALQEAGLIHAGDELFCYSDYDENTAVFVPPVVTMAGSALLRSLQSEEPSNGRS